MATFRYTVKCSTALVMSNVAPFDWANEANYFDSMSGTIHYQAVA